MTDEALPQGPLSGLRVIEMGSLLAGPFCGQLLGDFGAEVIKVEPPGVGDPMRQWGREKAHGKSLWWPVIARNKKSITVNLRVEEGQQIVRDLAREADFVLENFRPGTMEKWGLGYADLKAVNPRLVYCSISGYGQTGPKSGKGAFDVTVQGFSGLMSVTGEPGAAPVKCGVPVGDFCAGLYAAYTILARLMQARATGRGAHIDCSMVGSLIGVAALQTSEFFGTGRAPQALG